MKRFDGTEIAADELERFRALVDAHAWRFAKTYASFCPHEYTLKREGWNSTDLKWFVEFIWANGFDAVWGNTGSKRYFIDSERGWYYFLFRDDTDENGIASGATTLVNRASLDLWEVVEESDLFGSVYRWKLKKGWKTIMERGIKS